MKKFKRPCGCVIDIDKTGSGILLCKEHQQKCQKLNSADDIQKFLDEMMQP